MRSLTVTDVEVQSGFWNASYLLAAQGVDTLTIQRVAMRNFSGFALSLEETVSELPYLIDDLRVTDAALPALKSLISVRGCSAVIVLGNLSLSASVLRGPIL